MYSPRKRRRDPPLKPAVFSNPLPAGRPKCEWRINARMTVQPDRCVCDASAGGRRKQEDETRSRSTPKPPAAAAPGAEGGFRQGGEQQQRQQQHEFLDRHPPCGGHVPFRGTAGRTQAGFLLPHLGGSRINDCSGYNNFYFDIFLWISSPPLFSPRSGEGLSAPPRSSRCSILVPSR